MTLEHLEASMKAAKHWAQEEIDRLVYAGTRPVSNCPTVEAATREAAIARGNTIAHSAEIAEIESVLNYVSECLTADLYHEQRPPAPSPLHESALARFTELA
jgi:hypothetical protein